MSGVQVSVQPGPTGGVFNEDSVHRPHGSPLALGQEGGTPEGSRVIQICVLLQEVARSMTIDAE